MNVLHKRGEEVKDWRKLQSCGCFVAILMLFSCLMLIVRDLKPCFRAVNQTERPFYLISLFTLNNVKHCFDISHVLLGKGCFFSLINQWQVMYCICPASFSVNSEAIVAKTRELLHLLNKYADFSLTS